MQVAFNQLEQLDSELRPEIDAAIARVRNRHWYVLGPEVEAFESAFATFHGGGHCVGVANGTDAIELSLRAMRIGGGDEVITVANTAFPTVCAIERSGARPVLVDIEEPSLTIDPQAVAAAITPRTRGLVVVHLYGHPANMTALRAICDRHGVALIEDCAQAHGAKFAGQGVGTFGDAAAYSFYPTKNLGAMGDGGAIFTRDSQLAGRARQLRNYGQRVRHEHEETGMNSRLDELQAAILLAKLPHLPRHNAIRRQLAVRYHAELPTPMKPSPTNWREPIEHALHLYVVRHAERDSLQHWLASRDIASMIHYPVPVHRQPAMAYLNMDWGSLPVTERVAREVLSLPFYVGLETEKVAAVVAAICAFAEHSR